jgi:hypothetical protein
MKKFEVGIPRTSYEIYVIEAETKEEAWKKAKEKFEQETGDSPWDLEGSWCSEKEEKVNKK